MFMVNVSLPLRKSARSVDPIHLVTQFYIPKSLERYEEVKEALRRNVANSKIDSIILLNEKMYTHEELGVKSSKIQQVLISNRVHFSDLFLPRKKGFIWVANADIFADESIDKVRSSGMDTSKKVMALLRYEFNNPDLAKCPLFGPRPDSNDSWIVHSNHTLPLSLFRFELGRPGCDNKLNYIFDLLGYEVCNDPAAVRTYHCHADTTRAYELEPVPPPYFYVAPVGGCPMFGVPFDTIKPILEVYQLREGNAMLATFIKSQKKNFIVPRVAGIENNAAFRTTILSEQEINVLKNNAGILLGTKEDQFAFSRDYIRAFQLCEVYASWEPWGHYFNHIRQSQPMLQKIAARPQFSTGVFDIFHFVSAGNPWTHALAGKKVLIISPFVDLMAKQAKVYPIDLFPNCTFVYLKPPMTQGDETNRGWREEFAAFCAEVKKVDFEVALCSCGGYGNPICAYIYSLGKSAIYVGGVLQMYFGIYGSRWIKERKEVLKLYLNTNWIRPSKEQFRPKGFEKIENGCYW